MKKERPLFCRTDNLEYEKICKLDNEKITDFIYNIDSNRIDELITELSEMNILECDTNEIVDKTCKILLDAAANTFGKYTPRSGRTENELANTKRKHKPWFNRDCKEARKTFRQCKGKYRRMRNEQFFK